MAIDAGAEAVAAIALVSAIILLVVGYRSVHVVAPYQQGVALRLGRFVRTLNPGFNITNPMSHVVLVDLRARRSPILPVDLADRSGQVVGTIAYRVVDAPKSVFLVRDLDGEVRARARAAVTRTVAGLALRSGTAPAVDGESLAALRGDLATFGVQLDGVDLEVARTAA